MKKQKNKKRPKKDTSRKAAGKEKYFYYHTDGHWKRNYLQYLKSLKTKKGDKLLEGMLVVESNLTVFSTSRLWFKCSHMYFLYDLVDNRGLRHSEIILRISNGVKIVAEAIEIYPFWLPSGFRLALKDCYFVPVASQNLIFISVLAQKEFVFNFNKDFCLIYL